MPVPRETGYPDYGFAGTNKYIPILFAGKTLEKFFAKTIFGAITVTDYVGEVKNVGDKVIIRTIPNITIRDYKKGMTLLLEYPESPSVEFSINRAKYYNFAMDDVDVKQVDMNYLDKFADDASDQLKIVYDSEFLGTIYTEAHAKNKGATAGAKSSAYDLGVAGTPLTLTKNNIVEKIVECGAVLDEQDAPEEGRFIVIPPLMATKLKTSDLKQAYLTGDSKSPLRTGLIGTIDRFEVYISNLLSRVSIGDDAGTYNMIFGLKKASVFIAQLTKNEMYRPQNTFADAMKGLVVYDFAAMHPKLLGHLYAKAGT